MTLRELTAHLQSLCHEGYSNEEVIVDVEGFGVSVMTVQRKPLEVNDGGGTHCGHIVILGVGK